MTDEKFIAALDIGTTTIRCFIYDSKVNVRGSATDEMILLYPLPGYFEICTNTLWTKVVHIIQKAIAAANLTSADIHCLGITTLRSSFVTWDRETGKEFHNIITWKDMRADDLVKSYNKSFLLMVINSVSHCIYLLTRNTRFLAGSVLKFMNVQTTLKLYWVLQHNCEAKKAADEKRLLFGTLESWLLYRLRRGNFSGKPIEHVTDITNASATGFYDPFTREWASWALSAFSIKQEMLPKVVDISYDFGCTEKSIFGNEIRIGCTMGDQSASMWGSCCFNKGDVKITLGTGSFLNVNTGSECHASVHGLYPIVAWQWRNHATKQSEIVYSVEGCSNDTASIIKWAVDFGLFTDPADTAHIAYSVDNTDGVFFIPAFSGLGAPINDQKAATGLIGLTPLTKNAHIVRAVLESIAFRIVQLYFCTLKETKFTFKTIRVDGGVSKNDFICQLLSDLMNLDIERDVNSDLSVLGAAFVAGLSTGVWSSRDELVKMRTVGRVFHPRPQHREQLLTQMASWERAVDRFKGWYTTQSVIDKDTKTTSRRFINIC